MGKNKKAKVSSTKSARVDRYASRNRSLEDTVVEPIECPNSNNSRKRKNITKTDTVHKVVVRETSETNSENNNAVPEPQPGTSTDPTSGESRSRSKTRYDAMDAMLPGYEEDLDYVDDVYVTIQAPEDDEYPASTGNAESNDDFDPLSTGDNASECESNVVTFKQPTGSIKTPQEKIYQNWKDDPAFASFIKKLVTAEVNSVQESQSKQGSPAGGSATPAVPTEVVSTKQGGGDVRGVRDEIQHNRVLKTPPRRDLAGNSRVVTDTIQIKSPSDTTIYAPALNFLPNQNRVADIVNPQANLDRTGEPITLVGQEKFDNQISQFIQGIRLQSAVVVPQSENQNTPPVQHVDDARPGTSGIQNEQEIVRNKFDRQVAQGKEKAAEIVLQAEQFKATVNAPGNVQGVNTFSQGQSDLSDVPMFNAGPRIENDDDFFHVSCHVDSNIKARIQRGDYVDLEHLLPKPRGIRLENSGRMDIVFRDGKSYFVPAPSDNRINSVRRWEQAFRVYAAIYSEANPSRAAEI